MKKHRLLVINIAVILLIGIGGMAQVQGSENLHLAYSSYLGGQGVEGHVYLHLDDAGNIILISHTSSGNFPTHNPIQADFKGENDAIFAKLSPDGLELLFSSFLGGSEEDFVGGAAFDSNDNMVAVGVTSSSDFPTVNALHSIQSNSTRDVFVAKLSGNGQSILFSTYLGGASDYYTIKAVTDAQDNIIIAGSTDSSNFPTNNAYQEQIGGRADGFVTKISSDGQQILWSTYFGGAWDDQIKHVTVDSEGNVIVIGVTSSSNFPITDNAYQPNKSSSAWDVFIAKLSEDGQTLQFSTYFGGSRAWGPANVITDVDSNIIVVGETNSVDFPLTAGAYQSGFGGGEYDCFISKLSSDGQSMLFSTYLGGQGDESPINIVLDDDNDLFVVGCTSSADFPVIEGVFQNEKKPSTDGFIAKFSASEGTILFSTFIGGSGDDYVSSIALVPNSTSFWIAGHCSSVDFPTANAYQENYGGGAFDLFINRFSPESSDDDSTSGFKAFSTAVTFAILAIWALQVKPKLKVRSDR